MESLYLKSQGLQHQKICSLCNITEATLATYLKSSPNGRIDRLKVLGYKGQPSKLSEHVSSIEQYFKEHPPKTTDEAQAAIEQLTGIKRCPTQIREFMKRCGLKCRKIGHTPGKVTTDDKISEQQEFKEQQLDPRYEEAKSRKRVIFFVSFRQACMKNR